MLNCVLPFLIAPYTASVSENVDGDYSIMKVRATDADDGSNKEIKYIITDVTIVGVSVPTDVEVSYIATL